MVIKKTVSHCFGGDWGLRWSCSFFPILNRKWHPWWFSAGASMKGHSYSYNPERAPRRGRHIITNNCLKLFLKPASAPGVCVCVCVSQTAQTLFHKHARNDQRSCRIQLWSMTHSGASSPGGGGGGKALRCTENTDKWFWPSKHWTTHSCSLKHGSIFSRLLRIFFTVNSFIFLLSESCDSSCVEVFVWTFSGLLRSISPPSTCPVAYRSSLILLVLEILFGFSSACCWCVLVSLPVLIDRDEWVTLRLAQFVGHDVHTWLIWALTDAGSGPGSA